MRHAQPFPSSQASPQARSSRMRPGAQPLGRNGLDFSLWFIMTMPVTVPPSPLGGVKEFSAKLPQLVAGVKLIHLDGRLGGCLSWKLILVVSVHQGSCMDMTWILLLGDIGQCPWVPSGWDPPGVRGWWLLSLELSPPHPANSGERLLQTHHAPSLSFSSELPPSPERLPHIAVFGVISELGCWHWVRKYCSCFLVMQRPLFSTHSSSPPGMVCRVQRAGQLADAQ